MATTVASLVEEVRSLLRDYGQALTLSAAMADTTSTSVSLSSVADLNPGTFLLIGDELLEVLEIFPQGTSGSVTAIRGCRGSTAATHASGSVVRCGVIYGNHEIIRALNQALDNAFPALYKLGDSTSTVVATDTWEYDIPSTIDILVRIEMSSPSGNGGYLVSRQWRLQDNGHVLIDDAATWSAGTVIRMIGYGRFTAMASGGSLDTSFPDSNRNALRYLTLRAAVDLEVDRQVVIGRRDAFVGITDSFQQSLPLMNAFVGITDSFQQSLPLMTAQTAKFLGDQCDKLLKQIRMRRIPEYMADPGRAYYGR
jgi:hypothetical protein